jgi:hypothetical protein
MSEFEQQIVIQLLEGVFFEGKSDDVTLEKCKQETISFSPEFPWNDYKQLRETIAVSEFPTDMVFLACKAAWESVNWESVVNEVKRELDADQVK